MFTHKCLLQGKQWNIESPLPSLYLWVIHKALSLFIFSQFYWIEAQDC